MTKQSLTCMVSLFAMAIGSASFGHDESNHHKSTITDWSGFYAGVSLGSLGRGYSITDLDNELFGDIGAEALVWGSGTSLGLQFGYNFQKGALVYGAELSYTDFNISETTGFDDDHVVGSTWEDSTALKAKIGRAGDQSLMYFTFGAAQVAAIHCGGDDDNTTCLTDGDDNLNLSQTDTVLSLGVGFAAQMSSRISIFGEYNYLAIGPFNAVYQAPSDLARIETSAHTFALGLNYHFSDNGNAVSGTKTSWGGAYAGFAAGFGGFGTQIVDNFGDMFDGIGAQDGSLSVASDGIIFGGFAGYNWDLGKLVVGIEADITATTFSDNTLTDNDQDHFAQSSWNWFSTVRGRIGLPVGDSLLYGTAGVALVNAYFCGADENCVTDGDEDLAFTETKTGLAVGLGFETQLTENMGIRMEYMIVDVPSFEKSYDTNQTANFETSAHMVRLGAVFRF